MSKVYLGTFALEQDGEIFRGRIIGEANSQQDAVQGMSRALGKQFPRASEAVILAFELPDDEADAVADFAFSGVELLH